jgi:hypothetical protein
MVTCCSYAEGVSWKYCAETEVASSVRRDRTGKINQGQQRDQIVRQHDRTDSERRRKSIAEQTELSIRNIMEDNPAIEQTEYNNRGQDSSRHLSATAETGDFVCLFVCLFCLAPSGRTDRRQNTEEGVSIREQMVGNRTHMLSADRAKW